MNKGFKEGGLAGKLSIGYQFNQNFSAKVGYLISPKTTGDFAHNVDPRIKIVNDRAVVSTSVFDVAGKAMFPVADRVNIFGKLGVALISLGGNIQGKDKKVAEKYKLVNGKSWGPEVFAGLSFDITPNIVTSLLATYILPLTKVEYGPYEEGGSTVKKRPGDMGFLSLGLAYNVG